ncbi:toprim domain-containing protein [Candidatus Woesearchaeota archaeon]|nr:toprim domain-containing protein [Candidatus Woesearchaeota archaeon]
MDEKEDILELLEEIRNKNLLVLVEGIKDKRALSKLGIGRIKTLNKPLFEIVEDIAATEKEIALLVDLDIEGKKLYSKLSTDLQKHKVKINNKLRNFLFKTPIRHIEGLASYLSDE